MAKAENEKKEVQINFNAATLTLEEVKAILAIIEAQRGDLLGLRFLFIRIASLLSNIPDEEAADTIVRLFAGVRNPQSEFDKFTTIAEESLKNPEQREDMLLLPERAAKLRGKWLTFGNEPGQVGLVINNRLTELWEEGLLLALPNYHFKYFRFGAFFLATRSFEWFREQKFNDLQLSGLIQALNYLADTHLDKIIPFEHRTFALHPEKWEGKILRPDSNGGSVPSKVFEILFTNLKYYKRIKYIGEDKKGFFLDAKNLALLTPYDYKTICLEVREHFSQEDHFKGFDFVATPRAEQFLTDFFKEE